jgi:hypothetical protein
MVLNPRAHMQHITDLKIIGMDEMRPARIQKEPYIDLVFKLSAKPPTDWCQDFNLLFAKYTYSVKINAETGLFIETWVRQMEEIPSHLDVLKKTILECSAAYIQRAKDRQAALASASDKLQIGNEAEQSKLNQVIAALKFD